MHAYKYVSSILISVPDADHEAFQDCAHLATGLLQSVKLTWPSLCISNAVADKLMLAQLVYRAYATELALKLFMTAENSRGISRLAPFTLRVGPFTTIRA
jgi:hypothetical protein